MLYLLAYISQRGKSTCPGHPLVQKLEIKLLGIYNLLPETSSYILSL